MSNQEAYERIIKGYRMPAPPKCPNFLYEIMLKCWSAQPEDRPEFSQIKKQLDRSSFELGVCEWDTEQRTVTDCS